MDPDRRERTMMLLEGRRHEYASTMWQAPTLTLVAQSFLLGVLTDRSVGWSVAVPVAVAGMLACATAMYALCLLAYREREFGERIRRHARALGLGHPNRFRRHGRLHPREWQGWMLWEIVLGAFFVADVFALFCTSR